MSWTLRSYWSLLILCCVVFVLSYFSTVNHTSSDPKGSLLTAQAILEKKTIRLDGYPDAISELPRRICEYQGHLYYYYPFGTSLIVAPFVWLDNLLGNDMAQAQDDHALQKILAALTSTLAFLLVYAMCWCYTSESSALFLSTVFVLGSSMMSTMGTALWNINVVTVLILTCVVLLIYEDKKWISTAKSYFLGFLLFAMYVVRPTAVTFAIPVLLYLLLKDRTAFIKTAIVGAIFLSGFIAFSLWEWGHWLPPYYLANQLSQSTFLSTALFGNLLSPARGLLVYSPYLGLTAIGSVVFFQRLRRQPLFWITVGWFVLHWLMISNFPRLMWWGGWSYGSRLFTEALPGMFLLTLLVWRAASQTLTFIWQRASLGMFTLAAIVAVFFNSYQGLYNPYTAAWDGVGTYNIDTYPSLLFDWKYPQFLASSTQITQRNRFYRERGLVPNVISGRQIRPTKEMREWQPGDVVTSPDIVALLDDSWYGFDPVGGARWMRGQGRIWVAMEKNAVLTLRLFPAFMNEYGMLGDEGQMSIILNGFHYDTLKVHQNKVSEVKFPLRKGINEVLLRWEAGELSLPNDPRSLAIAFYALELRAEDHEVVLSNELRALVPADFRMVPGLAILLGDGWYDFDPDWQVRWMRAKGRLWTISAKNVIGTLRLWPAAIHNNEAVGVNSKISVSINGKHVGVIQIQGEGFGEIPIPLRAGINDVFLQSETGEFYTVGDPRPLSIAFRKISIETEVGKEMNAGDVLQQVGSCYPHP